MAMPAAGVFERAVTGDDFALDPSDKVNTGPLEKFIRMVKGYPYGVRVDHVESDVSEAVFVGEDAYLLVKLITRDGSEVAFAFRLSRQRERRYEGMWMTDAVWPVHKY